MPLRQLFSVNTLKVAAAGLIGLAVLATGATLWALRNDAIVAEQRDNRNISVILANQISRSVREIDGLLREIGDRSVKTGVLTADQFRRERGQFALFEEMQGRLSHEAYADVLTVHDGSGRVLASTSPAIIPGTDDSDSEYFRYFNVHAGADLYVGIPVVDAMSGIRRIFFSRRVDGHRGDLAGVVTIGVPVEYLMRSYESISALNGQTLTLMRRDGTIVMRHPDVEGYAGRKMPASSPWYDLVAQGGGSYRSPGYFLHEKARLVAVQPLRDHPLVVNISTLETAALATWRTRALLIWCGIIIATVCSIVLLRVLTRQFKRLVDSEASLIESNNYVDAALSNMLQGLVMLDKDQRVVFANKRFAAMYRLAADVLSRGRPLADVLEARAAAGTLANPKPFVAALTAQIVSRKPQQYVSTLPDGRTIAVYNQPIPSGGWVSTHEDITERLRNEARIVHIAHHDSLTDLPNRALVRQKVDEALEDLKDTGTGFAFFIFDLDLFKAVNDSLGHPIGDALLKAIAERLRRCMRDCCTIGRIGGDEFAVIQTCCGDDLMQGAITQAKRLMAEIGAPYDIEGHPIAIGISIGIALAPMDGKDASELFKNADLALYRAKSEGRNGYRLFQPEMYQEACERHQLENDLRNALARDEFEVHYQQIVDVVSGRPCEAEALVRWRHSTRGMVAPDRFISLAEDIGFIIPLGEWVLRQACKDAAKWPEPIKIAVNLSPVQFRSPGLVEAVRDALATSGLAPERLELEITESVLLHYNADNIALLRRLSDLGVGIVLDDFGTGYSSLGYLRLHKFEKIKIDKSFVAEMSTDSDCAAIICAITGLAGSLGIKTTAEGVETVQQFELLRAAGCTQAQGYLFNRPQPIDKLTFVLEQENVA